MLRWREREEHLFTVRCNCQLTSWTMTSTTIAINTATAYCCHDNRVTWCWWRRLVTTSPTHTPPSTNCARLLRQFLRRTSSCDSITLLQRHLTESAKSFALLKIGGHARNHPTTLTNLPESAHYNLSVIFITRANTSLPSYSFLGSTDPIIRDSTGYTWLVSRLLWIISTRLNFIRSCQRQLWVYFLAE